MFNPTRSILQVKKLRPLAHGYTTSKNPESLSAASVPRGTVQWLPEVRGTEMLPAGSFVRAGRPLQTPCTETVNIQHHLCVPELIGVAQASIHLSFISCLLGP